MNEQRIAKQKIIARLALEKTQKYYKATIAGGAPRNWYGNMVAKDIDIFMFPDLAASLDQVVYDLHLSPDNLVQVKGQGKEATEVEIDGGNLLSDSLLKKPKEEYCPFDILEVWELEIRGERVQWIVVNPQKFLSVVEFVEHSFDFEICKIFFDGQKIIHTDGSKKDFENKTLTISVKQLLECDRLNTLPKRSKKMQKLFPDFKINIED